MATSLPDFHNKFKDKLRTQEQGADTINWLVCSKELKKEDSGQFFRDRAPEVKHFFWGGTQSTESENNAFWAWLEKIVEKK